MSVSAHVHVVIGLTSDESSGSRHSCHAWLHSPPFTEDEFCALEPSSFFSIFSLTSMKLISSWMNFQSGKIIWLKIKTKQRSQKVPKEINCTGFLTNQLKEVYKNNSKTQKRFDVLYVTCRGSLNIMIYPIQYPVSHDDRKIWWYNLFITPTAFSVHFPSKRSIFSQIPTPPPPRLWKSWLRACRLGLICRLFPHVNTTYTILSIKLLHVTWPHCVWMGHFHVLISWMLSWMLSCVPTCQ